jgi:hypothetical protein
MENPGNFSCIINPLTNTIHWSILCFSDTGFNISNWQIRQENGITKKSSNSHL